MKNKLAAVAAFATIAVSGCVMAPEQTGPALSEDGDPETREEYLARRRAELPPDVRAALPADMDPGFLMQDDTGCWNLVLEQSEPLTGILLRDGLGQPVCES